MRPVCWITWEDHRRSRELAKCLESEYVVITAGGPSGIRHIILALKTLGTLWRKRRHSIVVQNPSRVLAAVASLFKLFLRYRLVVDRHTNFRLGKGFSLNPAIWFVIGCSEFSLRVADLTIVTNQYLKELVESKGGRAHVLTDPIPESVAPPQTRKHSGNFVIFFVCTFSEDEPFEEVIGAAELLDKSVEIQISGNYQKVGLGPSKLPQNVKLTGFVSNEDYDELIGKADGVIALTKAEWCLVCGGYEAVSVEKPLITSETSSLKLLYGDAAIYTRHTPEDIADSIGTLISNYDWMVEQSKKFKKKYREDWAENFSHLIRKIAETDAP